MPWSIIPAFASMPFNILSTRQAYRNQREYLNEIKKRNEQEQERFEQNLAFQREAYEYQKELNNLQMNREDTALSRSIADAQANGINKLMMLDNPAQATPLQTYTPDEVQGAGYEAVKKENIWEQVNQGMNQMLTWAQEAKNIQQTQLQNELIEEEILGKEGQRNLTDSQTFLNQISAAKTDEDRLKIIKDRLISELEYGIKLYDYQTSRRYGIRTTDDTNEWYNTAKAIISDLANENSQTMKELKQILEDFTNSDAFWQNIKDAINWNYKFEWNRNPDYSDLERKNPSFGGH